jgi:hypothetical protein
LYTLLIDDDDEVRAEASSIIGRGQIMVQGRAVDEWWQLATDHIAQSQGSERHMWIEWLWSIAVNEEEIGKSLVVQSLYSANKQMLWLQISISHPENRFFLSLSRPIFSVSHFLKSRGQRVLCAFWALPSPNQRRVVEIPYRLV